MNLDENIGWKGLLLLSVKKNIVSLYQVFCFIVIATQLNKPSSVQEHFYKDRKDWL